MQYGKWVGRVINFLDVRKVTSDPQLAAKRSVYFNVLSRWLTNKVIIRHSSLSKAVKNICMLALTLAIPSTFPMILHSKGRITYLPSFKEILGSHTTLLTWTSPLIAIALEKGASPNYPSRWCRQDILVCFNTVRKA